MTPDQIASDVLIPTLVLVEVDYWLMKLGGPDVWSDFVADVQHGAYRLARAAAYGGRAA